MRALALAGSVLIAATPAAAQTTNSITLDALVQDVIANNPERQFYQRQIETAGVERNAAGRWADPEAVVEFGQRRAQNLANNAVTGEGRTYAVSVVQPIEFGGRIALRRAIADRQVSLARIGLQQFDATLAARARSIGYGLFAADEKAAAAREVAGRMRTLARVIVSRDPAGPRRSSRRHRWLPARSAQSGQRRWPMPKRTHSFTN
ncbi:hypothetical protein GCM10020258_56260 [Sphingomonas yabuuchiae]